MRSGLTKRADERACPPSVQSVPRARRRPVEPPRPAVANRALRQQRPSIAPCAPSQRARPLRPAAPLRQARAQPPREVPQARPVGRQRRRRRPARPRGGRGAAAAEEEEEKEAQQRQTDRRQGGSAVDSARDGPAAAHRSLPGRAPPPTEEGGYQRPCTSQERREHAAVESERPAKSGTLSSPARARPSLRVVLRPCAVVPGSGAPAVPSLPGVRPRGSEWARVEWCCCCSITCASSLAQLCRAARDARRAASGFTRRWGHENRHGCLPARWRRCSRCSRSRRRGPRRRTVRRAARLPPGL